MMDRQGRGLAETVWTRLDRKVEQLQNSQPSIRHRLSTWVVLAVGFLLLIALLALFIGGMRRLGTCRWHGDAHDWDGDGYPAGQEFKYGSIHSIVFRSQAQGNSWKKAHSSGVALAFIQVTILGVLPLVCSPIHG